MNVRLPGVVTRTLAVVVSLATMMLVGVGAAGSASAAPRPPVNPDAVPVTGTFSDGGSVDGTFDVARFTTQDGALTAVGTFTGTITDASGDVVASGTEQGVALPVDTAQSQGSCEILDLVLGPLDLDLLGLQVHLDTVHLNITAQQGPGNLLGNLLCAVAGLLDGPTGIGAILDQIAALLNRLLGALG
jgi:hypothetical protein